MAINIYFGAPGVGKTTLAAHICRKESKKRPVFANFKLHDATFIDAKTVGDIPPVEGAVLIIDEAGIEYNSRKIKTFTMELIQYYKLHRHLHHDVHILSQSHEDMDITLRRIGVQFWILKNIGPWIRMRQVKRFLAFDANTHDIVDGYELMPWITGQMKSLVTLRYIDPPARWIYMPSLYWRYDSWEHPYTIFKEPKPEMFINPMRQKGLKRKIRYWIVTRKKLLILIGAVTAIVLAYEFIMTYL